MIVKQRGSRSLQNPEETVTVSFLPKTSNIKKPFPVTHTKLLSDADLSSPGERVCVCDGILAVELLV